MTECDICKDGKDYKNLPVHKRFKHKLKSSDPAGETFLNQSVPLKSPSAPSTNPPAVDIHKRTFWDVVLHCNTKLKQEKKQATIEEIIMKLPRWSIKQRKPMFKPKNPNASWVQFIGFSRTRPPVCCWTEYDGVSISVGDMFFPAPHDMRGDVFPYDLDNGIPLLDNSKDFNDMSYWNKLVERVKNMYFTLGLVTGAGDFTKNIGLILLLVAIVGLIGLGNLYMSWQITQGFAVANSQIGNITEAVRTYIDTHP